MLKNFLIAISILLIGATAIYADNRIEVKSSPNYLIILVHGINSPGWMWMGGKKQGDNADSGSYVKDINDNYRGFGDLLGYLRNNLGLDGYVYYYTFSERDGRISLQADELANPNHPNAAINGSIMDHKGLQDQPDFTDKSSEIFKKLSNGNEQNIQTGSDGKGNSWLEQARKDFKQWYAGKHPPMLSKDVPEAVIPQKYILIAHSMGGIVAREYISSDLYNDDVDSLITIDSQHLGSDGAQALKKMYEYYQGNKDIVAIGELMGISIGAFFCGKNEVGFYTAFLTPLLAAGRKVIDDVKIKGFLGWYPNQPGVQDMDSQGDFIRQLNSKPFVKGNKPMKVRFITGGGIPTPSGEISFNRTMVLPDVISTVFSDGWVNGLPLDSKLMAIYLSVILGATVNQSGDIYSNIKSQRGEGLSILSSPNIDLKTYEYEFGDGFGLLQDTITGGLAAVAMIDSLGAFMPPTAINWVKLGIGLACGAGAYTIFQDRVENFLSGHGLIVKKIYENNIIDHALEDIVTLGGQSDTLKASGATVHAFAESDISKPTAGASPESQVFALLSNKNKDGSDAGSYHTITIEAITESNNHFQSAPIEFNGEKKWISGVLVKEAPIAIKGVIDTFLPKKLKSFEYSENFAAWKPVGAVDEWGNFTVKDLNFAEGQNVIAFRAESWIGNKMNQILTITLNTIPMLPSGFQPAPNSFTNNNKPEFEVNFAKSSYSASSLESVSLTRAILRNETTGTETDIINDTQKTPSGGTYDKRLKVSYKPQVPLDDGKYSILVAVNSNVGISQALWDVTIDTTAPTVNIEPLKAYSPKASSSGNLTIKYSVSDEASACLGKVFCNLYDQSGNHITQIATDENITGGEHYFNWNGLNWLTGKLVNDGTYNAKIKVFDLAGNASTSSASLTIDSAPPEITGVKITPKFISSKYKEMKLEAEITEKAQVFIKMTEIFTNAVNVYLGIATNNNLQYSWTFDNSFMPGPKDGIYNIELVAQDGAGNISNPLTIEAYRIDRTPPKVFGQTTLPYVLSNSGNNPYRTKLIYRLSEEDKAIGNRRESIEMLHKKGIRLYHER